VSATVPTTTTTPTTATTATRVQPRPLFCAIEHLHRDRALADAVRTGVFTHAGFTRELGTRPDWLGAALPEDEEWRIEWVKFYYGLDLAHAFRETGDHGYLRAWERLVRSWIAQVPSDHDASEGTARRIQNWLYAWTIFAAAPAFPGLDDDLATALVASLHEQVAHVGANLTRERNHRTLELYALFLVSLAFPELEASGALLAFATTELHRDLLDSFHADGVHRESSTHYHLVALRTFVAARENARRYGIAFAPGFDERLERACEFALHVHRPDGRITALSDADSESYAELLELAGRLLSRPDFLWAAGEGRAGEPPARRTVSFPDGGYFVQRSGWGDGPTAFRDERFLVFDCGPLGDGGHGHYDLLNIEVAAGGRPLIVDPGRYTYSEHGENMRRWFKGTAAHNTVVVDGCDQTQYHRGKPRGPVAQPRFLGRVTSPGLDVVSGAAISPLYEAIHERWIAFVRGEYWLVEDRVHGTKPHRYDLRFHLTAAAWGSTHVDGAVVRSPGLALVFEAPTAPRLEAGWVSERYGEKTRAPVVSVAVDGVREARFVTLVFPLEGTQPLPRLLVRRNVIEVKHDGRVDRVVREATFA
jgi:hypothetical protein